MGILVDVMTSLETKKFQDSECGLSGPKMNRAAEPCGLGPAALHHG